uniref:(northern house mosquito) hypothetical protein n=1 Tax=Culex pipiens TaxID=7175 RepID=A0A8D8HG77_CULPI
MGPSRTGLMAKFSGGFALVARCVSRTSKGCAAVTAPEKLCTCPACCFCRRNFTIFEPPRTVSPFHSSTAFDASWYTMRERSWELSSKYWSTMARGDNILQKSPFPPSPLTPRLKLLTFGHALASLQVVKAPLWRLITYFQRTCEKKKLPPPAFLTAQHAK